MFDIVRARRIGSCIVIYSGALLLAAFCLATALVFVSSAVRFALDDPQTLTCLPASE